MSSLVVFVLKISDAMKAGVDAGWCVDLLSKLGVKEKFITIGRPTLRICLLGDDDEVKSTKWTFDFASTVVEPMLMAFAVDVVLSDDFQPLGGALLSNKDLILSKLLNFEGENLSSSTELEGNM